MKGRTLYQALVLAAAAVSSWVGLRLDALGGLNLTDVLLLAALAVGFAIMVGRGKLPRLPVWSWAPAMAVTVLLPWTIIVMEVPLAQPSGSGVSPMVFSLRVVLSTLAVGIAIAWSIAMSESDKAGFSRIVTWWWIGIVVSAFFALLQWLGIAPEFELQQTVGFNSGRYPGLASHPNALAQAVVIALPVSLLIRAHGLLRVAKIAGIILLVSAILISGSRAGLLIGAMILFVTLIRTVHEVKKWGLALSVMPLAVAAALVWGAPLLSSTRLSAAGNADASDIARLDAIEQGLRIFEQSPFLGAGLGTWIGESAPLIFLACGGIFLFAFYTLFAGGAAVSLLRSGLGRLEPFVGFLCTSAVCFFGLLNNGVFERYNFWITFAVVTYLSVTTVDKPISNSALCG